MIVEIIKYRLGLKSNKHLQNSLLDRIRLFDKLYVHCLNPLTSLIKRNTKYWLCKQILSRALGLV